MKCFERNFNLPNIGILVVSHKNMFNMFDSWHDRNKLERKERRKARAFVSKYQPQPFEGKDDMWREWVAVGRDDFLVAHWQKFTNTWNVTGSNQQPSMSWRSRH